MSEHSEKIHSIMKDQNGYITAAQVTRIGIVPVKALNRLFN